VISAAVILIILLAWLGVWSNHFQNSFHFDDFPTIVNNTAIRHLSSVPKFFTNPRTFSTMKESASYRPLLSTWFAVDYWLGNGAQSSIFQAENFLWFAAQLLAVFALFRIIPGMDYRPALFGTLLYGLHPVTADTVNYPLQRGIVMGSFSVVAGMFLWIYWPRLLPQNLRLKLKRVPQHGLDEYLRNNQGRLAERYRKIIHLPVALYLWPLAPGLLAEPATAVFAPILVAYIILFETERKLRHAIPAAVLCVGYWIFQTIFTWRLGAFSRIPALHYWLTQPWVALRYLSKFFVPMNLSADTDLPGFANFWSPLAIAGYIGVAALIGLGIVTARRTKWRAVSFGIWWFLLALLPSATIPDRVVEADWRMFLPFVGLALAVSRTAWIGIEALERSRVRIQGFVTASVLGVLLLAGLGWATYQRNTVWESEASLWRNVMETSPLNGRAFLNYGLTRLAARDVLTATGYILRAASVAPHDAVIENNLALLYVRLSRDKDAEARFRDAVADGASWSPAYSSYGAWLLGYQRIPEAEKMAARAVELDSYDLSGRRTLMDIMVSRHQWTKLIGFAAETLRMYSADPDSERAMVVAQTGIEEIGHVEKAAKVTPTVDHYLALSAVYFRTQKYDESIRAAREALRLNPNQWEAYSNIALAYHTLGKTDDAIAALREELRIKPDVASAQNNLEYELAKKAGLTRPETAQ
jgi:protein O-mannosyl-transferase